MHRNVVFGIVLGVTLGAAGCFSASSGGSGPGTQFNMDAGIDGFPDDTTIEDSSADSTTGDVEAAAPEASGPEASGPEASVHDAGGEGGLDAGSFDFDAGDAAGALIRVANMAGALSPSIDFCVAPAGDTFAGPYLAELGVAGGIPYKAMSEYAALAPASSFTVRIVAAGSTGCGAGLVPDVPVGPSTQTVPTTVVFAPAAGADAGPAVTVFADDPPSTSPANQYTRFRVIHESPGLGPITIQIGAAPYVIPIQTGVPFGGTFATSTTTTGAPAPDAQGYVLPGMISSQIELVLAGTETTAFYQTGGPGTDSMTTFLVGLQGSSADPLGFVACDETAAVAVHLTACSFANGAPKTLPVRVLHAAPDQGPIDTCVKIGTLAYTHNLIAAGGAPGGLPFLGISGDLTLIPAGTDVNVGFVSYGSPCATSQFASIGTAVFYGELTATLAESQLAPSTSWQLNIFDTSAAVGANTAVLEFSNMEAFGTDAVDVYETEMGQSEVALIQGAVGPYHSYLGLSLTPDSYTVRIVDDTTMQTVFTSGSLAFAASQTYFLGWFLASSPSQGAVVTCPLGSRGANQLTACSD